MGFENATNMIRAKNYHEDKGIEFIEKKSLDARIQSSVNKMPTILQSPTIKNAAKDIMLRQKLSSNDLRRMTGENKDNEELEKICGSNDPAVIIAVVQYYEVNKKELKLD